MKTDTFLLLAAVAMIGCDTVTDTGDFTGTPPLRIAGTWDYKFDVVDNDSLASCHLRDGIIRFVQTQNGDQFTGQVNGSWACIYSGETVEMPGIVPVTVGELAGQTVRFIAFGCIHLGAVTGSPPDHFTGTLFCTFPVIENGGPVPFTGTWEAVR